MRETPGSIKIYLLLAGALGGLVQLIVFLEPKTDMLGKAIAGAGFIVAMGYVYGGASAKDLIAKNPQRLVAVLFIGGSYLIALALFILIFSGGKLATDSDAQKGLIRSALGLVITGYLLANVKRLAKESENLLSDAEGAPQADAARSGAPRTTSAASGASTRAPAGARPAGGSGAGKPAAPPRLPTGARPGATTGQAEAAAPAVPPVRPKPPVE